jgi:radical SAM superfamily enzyme YgiQ (UPF0313 family)
VVLLLSTYDLGKQPFGLASPAAWLTRAGIDVAARDLSRDKLDDGEVSRASIVAVYLPMHTATRLALPVLDRVRALNPTATLCAYGLYAPLSASLLREHGVTVVLGPEAEQELVTLAAGGRVATDPAALPRLAFITPERHGLPGLARYATLQMGDGTRRVVGATDASRGCKHRCRHCPIVPVYDGRFRVVPVDVVLADIDQQVAAGAQHITFGDPDFLNGPTHARRIVQSLHARHPSISYDVTIKVEHLLAHRDLLPLLADTGCAFITSAVEAVDDGILEKLDKGHTRADFIAAAAICRDAGLALSPTFVAFTPWTTIDAYRDLVTTVAALDLIEHVAPIQWGLRLLVTHGSRLLELDDIRARVQPFDRQSLTYPWAHDDPHVDTLQAEIMRAVGVTLTRPRAEAFATVARLAGVKSSPAVDRATIPYLNEPWYC